MTGNAVDAGPFRAAAYRAHLFHERFPGPPANPWPWPDLEPGDFDRDADGYLVGIVAPAHAELAARLSRVEGSNDPIVDGPDGVQYLLRLRPLLPDELP